MNSATSSADLGELGQIGLTVDQLDRSIAFDRHLLALMCEKKNPPNT